MNNPETEATTFEWKIHHPFLTWRRMEASFLAKYGNLRVWSLRLDPYRGRAWPFNGFNFSLAIDPTLQSPYVFAHFKIIVMLNGRLAYEDKRFEIFMDSNSFMHSCYFSMCRDVTEDDQRLEIVVTVWPLLERKKVGYPFVLWGRQMDLEKLSDDLAQMRLSDNGTMNISSITDQNFSVHPYIMETRWTNLFEIHELNTKDIDGFTLRTGISTVVLRDLLHFLYSGRVPEQWRLGDVSKYTIELFQVINRYYLHHLYRLFVTSPLHHFRDTFTHLHSLSFFMNLEFEDSETFRSSRFIPIRYELNNIMYDVRMGIYTRRFSTAGFWLSYDLLSESPEGIHVQVIIELVDSQTVQMVLTNEHTICVLQRPPISNSGPVLFLGTRAHFQGCANNERIRLRFHLKFTDFGSNFTQYGEDISMADDSTALVYLCEHMWITLFNELQADTKIISALEDNKTFRVHKSILSARIPKWVNLDFTVDGDGFNVVRLPLHTKAIDFLVKYVYTGKVDHFPRDLEREIHDFSYTMEFWYLAMQLQTEPQETNFYWFME